MAAICVATIGTADSFLKVAHLIRTRHVHQVTAISLAKLQHDAYKTMCNAADEDTTFEHCKNRIFQNSSTFDFWDNILQIELLVLIFVRSHRARNFSVYMDVLETLVPWFLLLTTRTTPARYLFT